MNKYEKCFACVAGIYFLLFSYFALTVSLLPDEGTHLLLAIFYRDLFAHLAKTGISFENAWNYGLEYLLHYPKLQIAYPPVYHFLTGFLLVFFRSELAGRFLSVIFCILSAFLVFKITEKISSPKGALISSAAFLSYLYVFRFSFLAQQDMCVYFFTLLSLYFFLEIRKRKSPKNVFLLGILCSFAALSKQMGGFTVFIYALILLTEKTPLKERVKNILLLFSGFSLLTLPYVILLSKVGGIEINMFQGFYYAFSQGEPTSYLSPMLWMWYFVKPFLDYPPFLALLAALVIYARERKTCWKEFLVFSLFYYLALSAILNKELRFSTFFLMPAFVSLGVLTERKNALALSAVLLLFLPSLAITFASAFHFPLSQITATFTENGNVAYFGEGGKGMPFSSVIMWMSRKAEGNKVLEEQRYHFRGCNFVNLTKKEEILSTLKKKGIRYIIVYPNSPVNVSLISDRVKLLKKFETKSGNLEVYEFLDYERSEKFCNRICLTGWKVCREKSSVKLIKS